MTMEQQIAQAVAGKDSSAPVSSSSGASLKTTSKSGLAA